MQKDRSKNEGRSPTEKMTPFYSEFNADYEYVILFEKYFGQKLQEIF